MRVYMQMPTLAERHAEADLLQMRYKYILCLYIYIYDVYI